MKNADEKQGKPSMGRAKTRPKTRGQAPKKSRNFKIRPTEESGLVSALRSDNLDKRTRPAREVLGVRDATAAAPFDVTLALARDALSVNAVIMAAIARHLTGPDATLIDADGNPNELIVKHWPEAQRMVLVAAREVRRMEMEQGRKPDPSDTAAEKDLTTLILEAQRDGGEA